MHAKKSSVAVKQRITVKARVANLGEAMLLSVPFIFSLRPPLRHPARNLLESKDLREAMLLLFFFVIRSEAE